MEPDLPKLKADAQVIEDEISYVLGRHTRLHEDLHATLHPVQRLPGNTAGKQLCHTHRILRTLRFLTGLNVDCACTFLNPMPLKSFIGLVDTLEFFLRL